MRRAAFLLIILVLALSVMGPDTALAQPSAASATWSSNIIYFNLSPISDPSKPKNLQVVINGNGKPFTQSDTIRYQYFSNTILAGSIGQSYTGSAVVSAEVPVVAVYKQVASSSNPYSPILYTSFSVDQAGDGVFYVPSVQRSPTYVSQIGIQNVEAVDLTITLDFYVKDGNKLTFAVQPSQVIKSQTSWVFKLSDLAGFPLKFDGSMVINASSGGASPTSRIVAVVQEVQSNGRQAYAYEGAAAGSGTIYMPSAMCKVGKTQQTTYYAIQNADSNPGTATITYYDGLGKTVATEGPISIPAYHKVSVSTCDPAIAAKTSGKTVLSAVITGTNLVAMGKVQSTDGLMTAFLGSAQPRLCYKQTDGNYHVALPYVEWSNSTLGFRTYIAVMNASSDTSATNVSVNYYRRTGKNAAPVKAILQMATGNTPMVVNIKRNTEPDQVNGALDSAKSFIGAVEVVSDQPVVVIVRVQRGVSGVAGVTTLGEDYSGINIQDPTTNSCSS
jgi:hypothetical protein